MAEYRIIKRAGQYVAQRLLRRATWWRSEDWADLGYPCVDLTIVRKFRDDRIKKDIESLAWDSAQPYEVIE